MYLQELLNGVCYDMAGGGNPQITALSCDTSTIEKGCLFFCLKGNRHDGHNYYRKAVGDGAAALVCEHKLDTKALQIVVRDSRLAMAQIAKNFYENCADKLKIISVVGTNGKTSTAFILESILCKAGYKTGLIGTNGVYVNGRRYDCSLTTPDPIELHYWFRQMYLNQVEVVVMEVSAHAIALNKMRGVFSQFAIFTNFSQDHLDYFKTMQRYAEVKSSFFCDDYVGNAIVNVDDNLGRAIAEKCPKVATYSTSNGDAVATNVQTFAYKTTFDVEVFGQHAKVETQLLGEFNVYNLLAALTCASAMGIDIDTAVCAVKEILFIKGRNETCMRQDGMRVVVDFAHTPDGIKNILSYLRQTTKGKLIVVFGCGGNRDKFKRPIMAEVVSAFADFAVLTNDNPRFEDPRAIARDVVERLSCEHKVILNRNQATEYAVSVAKAEDTVAVLGKGAEEFQEIRGKKLPYSDVEVVRNLLAKSV